MAKGTNCPLTQTPNASLKPAFTYSRYSDLKRFEFWLVLTVSTATWPSPEMAKGTNCPLTQTPNASLKPAFTYSRYSSDENTNCIVRKLVLGMKFASKIAAS